MRLVIKKHGNTGPRGEMVDTLDLGSSVARCAGSTPVVGTIMTAFKIKHRPTNLYFDPSNEKNNVSRKGKKWTTREKAFDVLDIRSMKPLIVVEQYGPVHMQWSGTLRFKQDELFYGHVCCETKETDWAIVPA